MTQTAVDTALLAEIEQFSEDSQRRYRFNNRWDIVLTGFGILLSVGVVSVGFLKRPEASAIIGALIGALVTAQKAFPVHQRAEFYRMLCAEADTLFSQSSLGLVTTSTAAQQLATLRLNFARQLPQGTSPLAGLNASESAAEGLPAATGATLSLNTFSASTSPVDDPPRITPELSNGSTDSRPGSELPPGEADQYFSEQPSGNAVARPSAPPPVQGEEVGTAGSAASAPSPPFPYKAQAPASQAPLQVATRLKSPSTPAPRIRSLPTIMVRTR